MTRAPRMITATAGRESAGKSDWSLRNTPRPCTYLNFDFGIEGIGGPDNVKLIEGVTFHDFSPFSTGYARDKTADQARARGEMDRFLGVWREAIAKEVPLIVCDTFTAAWQAQRIARKDDRYLELEAEFHGLVRDAYTSTHTSLILIHHMKKDWAKKSDGSSYPTGTYSMDGLDSVGTMVQLGINQTFTPPQIVNGNVMEKAKFEYLIWKARDDISKVGMHGPILDWPTLCTIVCPKVDWMAVVNANR